MTAKIQPRHRAQTGCSEGSWCRKHGDVLDDNVCPTGTEIAQAIADTEARIVKHFRAKEALHDQAAQDYERDGMSGDWHRNESLEAATTAEIVESGEYTETQ